MSALERCVVVVALVVPAIPSLSGQCWRSDRLADVEVVVTI